MKKTTKKIDLELEGLDGNAFTLIGAFSIQARLEGWSREEIAQVQKEATAGDYNKLLQVLMKYTN